MPKKSQETQPVVGYTVLARRYRPQQFADLIGQEAVAQALTNALKTNRVAHAYLFTGARGVGKTSTAHILAKALNCEKGPTPTPCDACSSCKSIAAGEDVDVLEIDGASNNKVDEVREIRGNVQYRPSRARFKIYIIDEVHMLSTSAFNALLKTLEEPPPHVKFIFATTEVQKIPVTILSRCQRFDFGSLPASRIVEHLKSVVTAEGLAADDEALEMVAHRAGGSMRDAQSLLDQLVAFGGDRLTAEQVHTLLGTAQDDRVLALAAAVLAKDAAKALELLGQAAEEGAQLAELVEQLMAYWRDLMVLNCTSGQARDLSLAPRHRDTLVKQASSLPLDTILAGLDILSNTRLRMTRSNHARVLVEMGLVRLTRLEDLLPVGQLARWLGQVPAARSGAKPVEPPEGVKKKPLAGLNAPPGADAPAPPNGSRPVPLSVESLPRIWEELLVQAGPMLAGELRKAEFPAISGPNTLVIRFPAGYNDVREYCQESARQNRVESLLRKLTGQPLQLRMETTSGVGPAPEAGTETTAPTPPRHRRQRAEAAQEPLLHRAIEALGAQIVRMDDDFGAAPAPRPAPRSTEGEAAEEEP